MICPNCQAFVEPDEVCTCGTFRNTVNDMVIKKLYAYIVTDEKGLDAIPTFDITGLGTIPMLSGKLKNVYVIENMAQILANRSNVTIRLFEFSHRKLLKEIKPDHE